MEDEEKAPVNAETRAGRPVDVLTFYGEQELVAFTDALSSIAEQVKYGRETGKAEYRVKADRSGCIRVERRTMPPPQAPKP